MVERVAMAVKPGRRNVTKGTSRSRKRDQYGIQEECDMRGEVDERERWRYFIVGYHHKGGRHDGIHFLTVPSTSTIEK
jgi:hypothetical protein